MITSTTPLGLLRALRHASRESGRPVRTILGDYLRLRRAGRRLFLAEFLAFGLWRRGVEPEAYVGVIEGAVLSLALNYRKNRRALVHDKLLFDAMLRGLGFPVPELQAVMGKVACGGQIRHLPGAEALAHYLVEDARYPLFIKPAKGQNSLGAAAVTGFDAESGQVTMPDGTPEDPMALAQRIRQSAEGPILIQSHLSQHPEVAGAVGPTVACLRVITFLEDGVPTVLRAFWKIPVGGAVADNLWRGNMIAAVDADTGCVGQVRAHTGLDAPLVATHPETGAGLAGRNLPNWDQVVDLACRGAMLLRGMPLVGWDIALGADGPVIVEANSVPSVELTQYAEGRGFLIGDLLERIEAELARLKTEEIRDAAAKRSRVKEILGTRILAGFGVKSLTPR